MKREILCYSYDIIFTNKEFFKTLFINSPGLCNRFSTLSINHCETKKIFLKISEKH